MITKPPIDPDIRRFIDTMREDWKQYPPFETLPLDEARQVIEKIRTRWREGGPTMASTRELTVETGAGPLRLRVHRPEGVAAIAPAMLYIHGGGFTVFSLDTHDRLMREYAARGGFVVVGVDYPLSPEAKFPAALDRITGLMMWLADHAAEIGVDARRMALAGDSAGGNLSVATCLRLRDQGRLSLVRCVLSNYGGWSGRISDEAEALHGGADAILHREECKVYWSNYLNHEGELDDPYANPINADPTGLPPIFLVIAEIDVVSEANFRFGERLIAAGVMTTHKVYKGATHSFLEAVSISPLAVEALEDGARFVRDHLSR